MQQQVKGAGAGKPLAWAALAVCCLDYYMVTFHRMSPAVMAAELKAEFATTSAVLGLLSSIYFIVYGTMQIPVGYLVDRYSPGKVLGFFMGIASLGSMIFGGAHSLGSAVFARGLTSFGLSATFVTSTKLIGQVFDRNGFILAQGIMIAAGNVGSVTAASPLAALVDSLGWRSSFFIMGAATAALTALTFVVVDRQEFRAAPSPSAGSGRRGLTAFEMLFSFVLGFAILLKNGPLFSFQGLWGVPFLMDVHGLNKMGASAIVMTMSLAAALTGPIAGAGCKASRLNERHFLNINAVLYAISWVPIAITFGRFAVQSLYFAAVLFGFSSTAMSVMMQTIIRDVVDEGGRGVSIGISNGMSIFGGAVFQPLMGFMLDRAEAGGEGLAAGYSRALTLGMISATASAALFILACHMAKGRARRCDRMPMAEATR